jgi:hypothetical protein
MKNYLTHKYMTANSSEFGTGFSIESGGTKLVSWVEISPFSQIVRLCKCFPYTTCQHSYKLERSLHQCRSLNVMRVLTYVRK